MIDAKTREACANYVGKERQSRDNLAPEPAQKLAVLLGRAPPGERLPPTWHWVYFNAAVPRDRLGADLHEKTGLFLPPAPFTRRMWAAGDVTVHSPLRLGVPAHRRSAVEAVEFKEGRSGAMCFVAVAQEVEQAGRLCIVEKKTIVYRDRGKPDVALKGPDDPVPEGFFTHPDSQVFFYSALTHNGHRIHWDRDYCREVEGYPDLVVQGPLMATELCEAMREGLGPCRFRFRAQAPVFTTSPVRIDPGAAGPERKGQIIRADGVVSMTATLGRVQT